MSHNKDYSSNAPLEVSGCPTAPYEPGSYYLITDLDQGNLEDFTILTFAIDATTLDANVTVNEGWQGIVDWLDCQLVYLQDNNGNQVFGKNTISNFIWGTGFTNNYVSQIQSLTLDPLAIASFRNNYIYGTETVISITDGTVTVDNNIIGDSTTIRVETANVIATIANNQIHGDTLIELSGAGTYTLSGNEIQNAAILLNNSQSTLTNNTVNNSTVSITSSSVPFILNDSRLDNDSVVNLDSGIGAGGQISVNRCSIQNDSTINFSISLENIESQITVSNVSVEGSSDITFNGGNGIGDSVNITNSSLRGESSITLPTITGIVSIANFELANSGGMNVQNGIGNHQDGFVFDGLLNTGGFNTTSIKLEAASSLLVADVFNATKSGYVGALP